MKRLIYIKELEPHIQPSGKKALYKCFCGNEFEAQMRSIKSGNTKSCGCLVGKEIKHGLSNHPLYLVWNAMKNRCYNVNCKGYKYWGGRGITICKEWINDPEAFIKWAIKNGWREGLEIDRRNNDGNYEPSNCHFTTSVLNQRNKRGIKLSLEIAREIRNAKLLIVDISQRELARAYGVCQRTIQQILSNKIWI